MIVADTHAIVWWVLSPSKLTDAARAALDTGPVHLPIISCLEIANLTRRGRVELPLEVHAWLDAVLELPNVSLSPLTLDIAVTAGLLGIQSATRRIASSWRPRCTSAFRS